MQILIWKAYGDIKVYCAETKEQLKNIAETVYVIVKDWGIIEDNFDFNLEYSKACKEKKPKAFIQRFVDEYCDDSESFEQFYFDTVRYN